MLVLPLAHFSLFSGKLLVGIEMGEGVERRLYLEDDVTSLASIATIGAPFGNELFPAEGHATIATVSGSEFENGLVAEGHKALEIQQKTV